MHDLNGSPAADLRWQAMLYAAGEMNNADADAFEARLGTDADAQQALVQVVQLAGLVDGSHCAPSSSYRTTVRAAVRTENRRVRRRAARFWASISVAAAVVLLVTGVFWQRHYGSGHGAVEVVQAGVQQQGPQPETVVPALAAPQNMKAPDAVQAKVEDPRVNDHNNETLGVAEIWAELSNSERLRKVLEYELRRKLRMPIGLDRFQVQKPSPGPMIQ